MSVLLSSKESYTFWELFSDHKLKHWYVHNLFDSMQI